MLTAEQYKELLEKYNQGVRVKELSELYGISVIAIRKCLGNHYKTRKQRQLDSRVKLCDDSYFSKINTEQKAYWLGFISADGCLYTSKYQHALVIEIHPKDRKLLDWFLEDTKSNYKICEIIRDRKGKIYTTLKIAINSRKWIEDLKDKGLTERKSLTLCWPNKIPKSLIRHFIRGVLDGDGCIRAKKDKYVDLSFSSGSNDFIKELKIHLDILLKESGRLWREENGHNGRWKLEYYIGTKIEKRRKFFNVLYKDATRFLQRKQELLKVDEFYER